MAPPPTMRALRTGLHRQMQLLEEGVGLFLRSKESDLIALLQHKVTVGDDDPAAHAPPRTPEYRS